jgi:hypothetical protein
MNQYKPKHPIKKGTQNYILSDYVNTILDETGVDIRIKSRKRHQQDLQKIFCKFAHWHLRLSLSFIGEYINRDHASVLHACRKYDNLYSTDKDFREKADFFIGRFLVIDAKEETQVIKKALIELIERISEKDRARVYAVAVDILEGNQTVSITKDEIIKLIDQQTSKLILTDE